MQSLLNLTIHWRWLWATIGALCLVASYPASQRLEMDRRVASLFAENDPTLIAYHDFKHAFGGNEVILIVYRDDDLATQAGMQRNQLFSDQIRDLPGVAAVISPAVLNDAARLMNPMNLIGQSKIPPLMRDDEPVASGLDEIFGGYTHSSDHTRGGVVAMLTPSDTETSSSKQANANQRSGAKHDANAQQQTAAEIRRLTGRWQAEHGIREVSVVGEPVLIHDAFALIERDGNRLAIWTVGLLSLVVLISLCDLRFVALTGLVIVWSVLMTRATMVWAGVSMSLIASILTAIVTVIAVASILHLGVRFHRMRFRGHGILPSARRAMSALAVFLRLRSRRKSNVS